MCAKHFNEPVLIGLDVCRLIGYAEDDFDAYLICRRPGGKLLYMTCVGGYIFLNPLKNKGYTKSATGEEWDDFSRLDNLLTLNDCPKEESFIIEFEKE